MKEKAGEVFSIARDNPPIKGCTVSKEVSGGENNVLYFSMDANTDISAEIFPYYKFMIVIEGSLEVYGGGLEGKDVSQADAIFTPPDIPVGVRTKEAAVFTEINIRKGCIMNEAVKAGEVFSLAKLVPYQEGKIVNMDVVHNDKMKFVVMAFDEGTGLSEHAAPGEAIVFALEGEGVIGYSGVDHAIKAGEQFHFAKGGLHSVRAKGKFKMALLLTLE